MAIDDGWKVIYGDDSVQVIPVDDIVEHEEEDCACGPNTSYIDDDGTYLAVPVVTHHSLDDREKYQA